MTARETAARLLTAFAQHLEPLVPVPERRYVAPGNLIPWDGEQLVVTLQGIQQGQPGAPFAGTFVPGTEVLWAQYAVAIVRVVPALSGSGSLEDMVPGADELGEAGAASLDDSEALWKAAVAVHAAFTVTELGMGFTVGPLATVGPEGGLAGERILLDLSIH